VLVFRDQKLSDDDLLAFSRHFGTLDPPPNQGAGKKSPPGYPDIYVVSNVLDVKASRSARSATATRLAHRHELHRAAADASMLYSLEIPSSAATHGSAG